MPPASGAIPCQGLAATLGGLALPGVFGFTFGAEGEPGSVRCGGPPEESRIVKDLGRRPDPRGAIGSLADVMTKQPAQSEIPSKLLEWLGPKFPGITVELTVVERWARPALILRWAGFDDLLPEERFHRLFHAIPEEFYETKLRGCVWCELGGSETIDEFLKLPRSEDVAAEEPQIVRRLVSAGFFDVLAEALGSEPTAACRGDFAIVRRILAEKKFAKSALQNALLVLMRNGAYCDCEVLFNAQLVQLRTGSP